MFTGTENARNLIRVEDAKMTRKAKQKKVYMAVTPDKYELPIAIADDVLTLAKMVGVKSHSIYEHLSHIKSGYVKQTRYVKVILEDEDD